VAKSDLSIDGGEYAPVAARITLFYERFPEGCIHTRLVSRSERDVTFKAVVYRTPHDPRPAAIGWASERPGDGDINSVACVENTETSAVGRALANLGFTASRERPSWEEMVKADRARDWISASRESNGVRRADALGPIPVPPPRIPRPSPLLRDLLRMIAVAERRGSVRPARAAAWRRRLRLEGLGPEELERVELRLRRRLMMRR